MHRPAAPRRRGELPAGLARAPREAEVDQARRADGSRLEEPAGVEEVLPVQDVLPHHQDAVRRPGGPPLEREEGPALLEAPAGGLLAQDVLPRRERRLSEGVAPVERHGDEHRLDLRARQQRGRVGRVPRHPEPRRRGERRGCVPVGIGERDDLEAVRQLRSAGQCSRRTASPAPIRPSRTGPAPAGGAGAAVTPFPRGGGGTGDAGGFRRRGARGARGGHLLTAHAAVPVGAGLPPAQEPAGLDVGNALVARARCGRSAL